MLDMKHVYGVIMAGGIGSRFWPVSTPRLPKQFHDFMGTGESLLQQTFRRLSQMIPAERIVVVTHQDYAALVAEQLPVLPTNNILGEPLRKNTAPTICWAAFELQRRDASATMVVCPSDHLILQEQTFIQTVHAALEGAAGNKLVTLGIQPTRPDTGYGYIQYEPNPAGSITKVRAFTEKPDEAHAKTFVESGEFLWNSGIFIWKSSVLLAEMVTHSPEIYQIFSNLFNSEFKASDLAEAYTQCKNESIDYALMEKSDEVYVIPSSFGWSDLGTWGSLYHQLRKDDAGNATVGKYVVLSNSKDNLVRMEGDRVAVIHGLEGYVVVDTGKSLLICPLNQEQSIRKLSGDVSINWGDRFD
jgi:mannose-1-phosphate guanylyltransferase